MCNWAYDLDLGLSDTITKCIYNIGTFERIWVIMFINTIYCFYNNYLSTWEVLSSTKSDIKDIFKNIMDYIKFINMASMF